MTTATHGPFTRFATWFLRRNPFYLISAVAMAVGARLFLVGADEGADEVAGDLRLIVQTFALLQLYEWAVTAVLLWLGMWGRSPEDRPSLLLVATAFWTGPLVATVEMTVLKPELGTVIAAGASVIAVAELRIVCRMLRLRISIWGQAVGLASLALVVAAPTLLRMTTSADRISELVLYGAWGVLALIVLPAIGSPRRPRSIAQTQGVGETKQSGRAAELIFMLMALGAAVLHLWGMNHAFDCYARAFYAAPLLVALSAVGMYHLQGPPRRRDWWFTACVMAPAAAIALTMQPFHDAVPTEWLPGPLRDPMIVTSALAVAVWWFGYLQSRKIVLLHAGMAAMALFAYRALQSIGIANVAVEQPAIESEWPYGLRWISLYVVTGYLLLVSWRRRSRVELMAAAIVHMGGVSALVWGRTPSDLFVICLLAGWSALVGLHLFRMRTHILLRLFPILWLVAVSWCCDSDPTLVWIARAHAAMTIVVLFLIGWNWRWTGYRMVAVGLIAAHIIHYGGRWLMSISNSTAFFVVICAFVLLAGGSVISWYRPRMLDVIDGRAETVQGA